MTVKVTKDRTSQVMKALQALMKERVLVGIPQEETDRDDPDTNEHITNAAIGYIADHGSPAQNIPARPWLDVGVKRAQDSYQKRLRDAAIAALDGNEGLVQRNLHAAGVETTNSVRAVVNEGIPPPLAKRTLAGRKRAGFKGTKPLIRSTQFRSSITYVLRKRP